MSLKVMLAEDHDENRSVLIRRLQKQGFVITGARDGVEAVALFEGTAPDIILMDLAMPNLSGFDAMLAIRAKESGRSVPIIALTAHAMDDVREKCEDSGFNGFVTKPVDLPALLTMMRALTATAAAAA